MRWDIAQTLRRRRALRRLRRIDRERIKAQLRIDFDAESFRRFERSGH